jgi:protein-tyrosine phosphatase
MTFRSTRTKSTGEWIGEGRYLLIESPYGYVGDGLERIVHELALDGFRIVLAHPERSACFAGKLDRILGFVERGAVCSVTAASLSGRFGRPVRLAAREMLSAGVVHNVASDAHGAERRTPRITPASEGIAAANWAWLTQAAPAAVIAGKEIPPAPDETGGWGPIGGAFARLRRR